MNCIFEVGDWVYCKRTKEKGQIVSVRSSLIIETPVYEIRLPNDEIWSWDEAELAVVSNFDVDDEVRIVVPPHSKANEQCNGFTGIVTVVEYIDYKQTYEYWIKYNCDTSKHKSEGSWWSEHYLKPTEATPVRNRMAIVQLELEQGRSAIEKWLS